ncbi:MAG: hypothetical protein AAFQ80_20675 [Cyanobacteria bacterium J06621_8]
MAGSFQDDSREQEMIELFELIKDENEGRSGIDAFLDLDGINIPFELKTTSSKSGSVTTVRDFGDDHIQKWQSKHWLFGFYTDKDSKASYYKYGSPELMQGWIKEKEEYIKPDFQLAKIASKKLTLEDLYIISGEKEIYSLEDAKSIQKRQYSTNKYIELQDIGNGYSKNRMLQILQDRATYLMKRGSTLNNPHIPGSYFR